MILSASRGYDRHICCLCPNDATSLPTCTSPIHFYSCYPARNGHTGSIYFSSSYPTGKKWPAGVSDLRIPIDSCISVIIWRHVAGIINVYLFLYALFVRQYTDQYLQEAPVRTGQYFRFPISYPARQNRKFWRLVDFNKVQETVAPFSRGAVH